MKHPPAILAVLFALWIAAASAAAGTRAPGTQDGADVYHGALALRSTGNGYVLAIEGDWGSRNFFFRSLEPVEPLAQAEPSGKIVHSPRELIASLPSSRTLLRLVVPYGDKTDPETSQAFQSLSETQRDLLLDRYGAQLLVEEVEGFELAMTGSVRPGLRAEDLPAYDSEELVGALEAARSPNGEPGLEILAHPYFHQTPPEEPNGGTNTCTAGGRGSDSCSKSCGSSGDSCSVSCRSPMTYSCCYCHSGTAFCVCRLAWP